MIVDWGVKKADELGLETFVFAGLGGVVPIFEKAQYLMVDKTMLDMEIPNPSDEWKERQKQLGESGW